jgi:hypothetical protein
MCDSKTVEKGRRPGILRFIFLIRGDASEGGVGYVKVKLKKLSDDPCWEKLGDRGAWERVESCWSSLAVGWENQANYYFPNSSGIAR